MPKEAHMDALGIPEKVTNLQQTWGEAIVAIGKAHTEGDVKALQVATESALDLYDFPNEVLFKPTKASEQQFRNNRDAARSYFVAGNEQYAEDHGFALVGWTSVRFENSGFKQMADGSSLTMGNYFFGDPKTGSEVKVEYTFGYTPEGKIFLHHSSLPYQPSH
jgi:hypothetical protein